MFENMDEMFKHMPEELRSMGSHSSSTSTIIQNGKTIIVKTVNNKTTVTVNGKEWEEKKNV
jgi:hypothetical protein